MYTATRCLAGRYLRLHIIIFQKPDNIDIMQYLFRELGPLFPAERAVLGDDIMIYELIA